MTLAKKAGETEPSGPTPATAETVSTDAEGRVQAEGPEVSELAGLAKAQAVLSVDYDWFDRLALAAGDEDDS